MQFVGSSCGPIASSHPAPNYTQRNSNVRCTSCTITVADSTITVVNIYVEPKSDGASSPFHDGDMKEYRTERIHASVGRTMSSSGLCWTFEQFWAISTHENWRLCSVNNNRNLRIVCLRLSVQYYKHQRKIMMVTAVKEYKYYRKTK